MDPTNLGKYRSASYNLCFFQRASGANGKGEHLVLSKMLIFQVRAIKGDSV